MTPIDTVLIVRSAFDDIYEPAWNRALNELGIKSKIFETHSLTLPGVFGRIERRILWGPGIIRIKRNFVEVFKRERPDVTLFYQGHYFDRETLEMKVQGRHEDLVNAAALQTIAYGGDVFILSPEEVPGGGQMAAITRF